MANHEDRRAIGERYAALHPSEQARNVSTIPPLPYFPNLKLEIRSVTAAILLTYLEIHHPAPQDPIGGISSPPVTLNLLDICDALQVSRRTLQVSLLVLGVWWTAEAQRFAASRAGREFINPDHTFHGKIKPYSYVGPKDGKWAKQAVIRRNLPRMKQLLTACSVPNITAPVTYPDLQDKCHWKANEGGGLSLSSTSISSDKSRLAELLLRASVLDGDRRKVRYPRLRAAVADKLVDRKALSAKQPKRGRTDGVDPVLPDGMEQRIKKRSR